VLYNACHSPWVSLLLRLAIFTGYAAALPVVCAALLTSAAFRLARLTVHMVATSSRGWLSGPCGLARREGAGESSPATPLPGSVPHGACGSAQSVNLSVVFNLE